MTMFVFALAVKYTSLFAILELNIQSIIHIEQIQIYKVMLHLLTLHTFFKTLAKPGAALPHRCDLVTHPLPPLPLWRSGVANSLFILSLAL